MRKLMWFSIGFGICCGFLAYGVSFSPVLPFISLLTAVLFGVRWKQLRPGIVLCIGFLAGMCWFSVYRQVYLSDAIAKDGLTEDTTVVVKDYGYDTDYGTAVDGSVTISDRDYRIRVYINEKVNFAPGDVFSCQLRFRVTTADGEDEATYHPGKGIFLLGYAKEITSLETEQPVQWGSYPAMIANAVRNILRTCFPEDTFAFVQALLLGDTTDLSYETDTSFQVSGIRHVVAVSGLHVSILFGMISMITFRKRYLTALVGFPVLFLFAAMAGFTPSVTRASIMSALMLLSLLADQEYDGPTALAFAALVMLILNPLVITAVGFQLSVGSVAGIFLFYPRISGWLQQKLGQERGRTIRSRLKSWFVGSVSVTLSAMSLTTPLCAVYFETVSLVGILTNLLVLWVIALIFYGILSVCLLYLLFEPAAVLLGSLISIPVRYVLLTAKVLSKIPLAAVYTASAYIVAWLAFVYLLLLVFLLQKKRRPKVLVCCACIGLCIALAASWLEPMTDECRVTVLDVGQGQSILIQSGGRSYLVDCGGDDDETTADIVSRQLLSMGVSCLDGIILTHCDRDHAGGVVYLLTRVSADTIFLPVNADANSVERISSAFSGKLFRVSEDLLLRYADTKMTVFGPTFVNESNENSLCVLFETDNCAILITGDRGGFGERMLLRNGDLPDVDLLIAGHHGSKYSSTEELLQAVQPETVIISVGESNPYGHPAEELLQRLEEFGCTVYRTDLNGTIIYRR